ncbi:platelet-derived growth factor C isoform X1 [Chrysemys picta bellii]|uniref:platelet-derived growth factor C isoform X1 n=2 Tax=Chrysemys picta bellii TaxID=8478 RepID=UPI0032B2F4B6
MWKLPCTSALPKQAQGCFLPAAQPSPGGGERDPGFAGELNVPGVCDNFPRSAKMLLFAFLLLTSALASRRHGAQAESNLSVKLQFSSAKEQNGVQDPQHEKIITVSTNGSIHSPKFPHAYPRNTVLVWRLVAVEENVWIQLTFDERFGLEDPEDDICKYDFVEVEEPSDGTILGRWCGSSTVPSKQISKGNQIRIRFVSDEYFSSEPGFCIHYTLLMPHHTEAASPSMLPPSALPLDLLNNAVAGFSTVEELIRYLEPDRWQLDLEDLYRPTWQILGKAYIRERKSRAANVSPSQRLVKIRRRKLRTRDDMFTELQMSSHAERAQQNAWRQSMSDYRKAQYEREERWRAESRDEQSKWRAEDDRWRQLADRRQESMLRLLEHQTDMFQRMVELQERQQEQRPPLQPLCNQQPSSQIP